MTVIVVMGVSGSGKTTIGTALANALGVEYAEADTFHPQANIDKMTAGIALTDADRAPWLEAIAGWIRAHQESGGVVTSSALKRRYRDCLRTGGNVWFAHLHGDREPARRAHEDAHGPLHAGLPAGLPARRPRTPRAGRARRDLRHPRHPATTSPKPP